MTAVLHLGYPTVSTKKRAKGGAVVLRSDQRDTDSLCENRGWDSNASISDHRCCDSWLDDWRFFVFQRPRYSARHARSEIRHTAIAIRAAGRWSAGPCPRSWPARRPRDRSYPWQHALAFLLGTLGG